MLAEAAADDGLELFPAVHDLVAAGPPLPLVVEQRLSRVESALRSVVLGLKVVLVAAWALALQRAWCLLIDCFDHFSLTHD